VRDVHTLIASLVSLPRSSDSSNRKSCTSTDESGPSSVSAAARIRSNGTTSDADAPKCDAHHALAGSRLAARSAASMARSAVAARSSAE
jgi:hypothetical protein